MLFMLVRWVLFAVAVVVTAGVIPGITVVSFGAAMWAAVVIGLVNIFIRPVLILLTLPINILTLGFFTFIINALMLLLVSKLVPGFVVSSFVPALLGSILLSIFSIFINKIFFL